VAARLQERNGSRKGSCADPARVVGNAQPQKFNKGLAYATVPDAITARSEDFIRQSLSMGNQSFQADEPG